VWLQDRGPAAVAAAAINTSEPQLEATQIPCPSTDRGHSMACCVSLHMQYTPQELASMSSSSPGHASSISEAELQQRVVGGRQHSQVLDTTVLAQYTAAAAAHLKAT
jgi:hypothetical protein